MSGSYNDPRGGAIFEPRGKIDRIYVELHMEMLYIKYTSFMSCCCREDFLLYFHYKSMVDNDMPGAWPVWTPGVPLAALITESHTLVHTTYESSGQYGFGEEDFSMFLGARLAGFIKRTTIHCYTQHMKALGLVVSEKKIFSHCKSNEFGPWFGCHF